MNEPLNFPAAGTPAASASGAPASRRRALAAGVALAALGVLVPGVAVLVMTGREGCDGTCPGRLVASRPAPPAPVPGGAVPPGQDAAAAQREAALRALRDIRPGPPPALDDPALTVNDAPVVAPPTGVPAEPLRQALAAYRDGRAGAGDALAASLGDPVARMLLEWTAIRYNGATMPFARINAFLQRHPDWPAPEPVQRQAEYALMREKAPAAIVLAFFDRREPLTPHGAFMLASALKADGRIAAARQVAVDAWRNQPMPAALEKRFAEAFPEALTRAEHRNRMEHFLLRTDWPTALRAAAMAGPDYVLLARARMAVMQPKQPGKAAEKALMAVPEALRRDVSWRYSRAVYLRKTDDNEGARAIHMATPVSELAVDGGDEWWIERRILARRFLDAGRADVAYALVREHGAERDRLKIEAEFHAGWIALRYLARPQQALAHFDAAANIARTPVSTARALYWRGRAREALGDIPAAQKDYAAAARHGVTFYGQAARARLGDDSGPVDAAPAPDLRLLDAPPLRAIRLLHEAGADDMAGPLYAGLARNAGDAAVIDLAARLAAGRNDARAMVTIGKAAMQRGLPLAHVAWPVQGAPRPQLARQDVEPAMVLAIARQESVFDPAAVSPAGARGLMQLMPATARRTAERASLPFDQGRLTSDPAYNVTLGAHHFGELLDDWNGSYILAIAAYNAGGGNVKKWLAAHGDPRDPAVDPLDWIELIPFAETRNYVQRVLENLQVYRSRLQPGAPLRLAADLRRGVALAGQERQAGPAAPAAADGETTSSIRPQPPQL